MANTYEVGTWNGIKAILRNGTQLLSKDQAGAQLKAMQAQSANFTTLQTQLSDENIVAYRAKVATQAQGVADDAAALTAAIAQLT